MNSSEVCRINIQSRHKIEFLTPLKNIKCKWDLLWESTSKQYTLDVHCPSPLLLILHSQCFSFFDHLQDLSFSLTQHRFSPYKVNNVRDTFIFREEIYYGNAQFCLSAIAAQKMQDKTLRNPFHLCVCKAGLEIRPVFAKLRFWVCRTIELVAWIF